MTTRSPTRRGFTMIELLTVIGIIVVLMAILLPVVGRVRTQAYVTDTQNQMGKIAAAIERYKSDTGFYPGPLSNAVFTPKGPNDLTMTENVTLGLCGGWEYGGSYNEQNVGKGATTHVQNLAKRTRLLPYMDPTPGTMMPSIPWSANGKTGLNDSVVPEFMDRFPEGKPILCMRANQGATGVTPSFPAGTTPQYDPTWLKPYVDYDEAKKKAKLEEDFLARNGAAAGLQSYFVHPTIPGTPRGKDAFILISAGADNEFFTKDDLLH